MKARIQKLGEERWALHLNHNKVDFLMTLKSWETTRKAVRPSLETFCLYLANNFGNNGGREFKF